jgi:hypothetical protein
MKYEIREVIKGDTYMAIFDKDGKQVTEWYRYISPEGLIEGQSRYYIAKKSDKYAIFDINGNMITPEWFDGMYLSGLVEGQSNYYIAKKGKKVAIFDISGNRITEWFDYVSSAGLVKGESDYFIACNKDTCAVHYKNGKKVSDDFPIEKIFSVREITFNDELGIVEIETYDGKRKSIEFNLVYPFKEEIIDYTKLLNI